MVARTKRAIRCNDKAANDGANGDTAVVPDENMVDDEVPNKDDLAAAVSASLERNRVSSGDAVEKIDDGEREEADAKRDGDEGEFSAGEELLPRRGRIMSATNMPMIAKKDLEGKKQTPTTLFDSATGAPTPDQSAAAREAKRAKQIARQADTVKQNSSLQPLAGGMVQLIPGELTPDAAVDKARVALSAAAKATVALVAMASAQAAHEGARSGT